MELILSGTIRDFKDSHPDFEYVKRSEKGIVEATLGQDCKPVYRGGGGQTTHSKELFDQWYRDVEGINLAKRFDITLVDPDGNGVFTYENDEFFPIDDELFGNQGRPHNYHFTYEIHSEFTYQGTEVFTFIGDDDLWLFIDGKLVIDLGGVHSPLRETLDLRAPEGKKSLQKTFSPGMTLVLEVGQTYTMDLFFAERHTVKSSFRIDTSVALEPLPLVTLQASDPQAQEMPTDQGEFVVRLDSAIDQDLAIALTVGGTAAVGKDYEAIPTVITIPAGQVEVKVPVRPIADRQLEGAETVTLALVMSEGYDLGASARGTVVIGDAVRPVVTLKVQDSQATEAIAPGDPADSATFLVCLDQVAPFDIRVPYVAGGTAIEGRDYQRLPDTVLIARGESKAALVITPLPDQTPGEGSETVVITLLPGEGYQLGSDISGQAVIREQSDRQASPVPAATTAGPQWIWPMVALLMVGGAVAFSLRAAIN